MSKQPAKTRHYHTASDEELSQWNDEADVNAWSVREARRVVRLMTQPDAPPSLTHWTVPLSHSLFLDFEKGADGGGWVRMSIRKTEELGINDLRDHWKEIELWELLLLESQGPWRIGGTGGLLSMLYHRTQEGIGPAELRDRLHESIVADITEYLADHKHCNEAKSRFGNSHELLQWQLKESEAGRYHFQTGLGRAKWTLEAMGFAQSESVELCEDVIHGIQQRGHINWDANGPITDDRIRKAVERWGQKHNTWLTRSQQTRSPIASTSAQ